MTALGWLLLLIAAGCTASANLLLRIGVDRANSLSAEGLSGWSMGLIRLVFQPMFDLGIILYITAAIFWFRIVSTETLSTAYPLFVSLAFVFVTLGASAIFRESISPRKLTGMATILIGIFMISVE